MTMKDNNVQWQEVRLLWRAFDPIGVYLDDDDSDWPDDEYDTYVTQTLKLLRENADQKALVKYITYVCHEQIEMETSTKRIEQFATKLVLWNQSKH